MRALTAIVRDTVLALTRRRLFWLHLWLSFAIVVLYAGFNCHQTGWSLVYGLKSIESPWLKHGTPWESTLHCWMLARIMRWWVAGGALFLALFATSAVLPETLEPGRAALVVPRAPRRSMILCGRFIGSLGYAVFHAAVVAGGLWLVLGCRMNVWHHSLWLAVPLAALLFAPLQAVAMLLGVLTRSATAALLVAVLFAGSVWAVQEAASPDETGSATETVSEKEEEINGSGISDAVASEAARYAVVLLPHSRNSLVWLERSACPRPPRSYRELFRRLRIGHSGLKAVAADAIAAASVPTLPVREEESVRFTPLLLSSAGFTIAVMAVAAWLLKRRDL
jgi:hypothetical protein